MAKNYASRNIRGKLRVCRYLRSDAGLRKYVPKTVAFSLSNLESMAGSFASVFVKPDAGSLGIGICKVKRIASGYELKSIVGKKQVTSIKNSAAEVYERIVGKKTGKLIIQQGIQLDRVNGRPYDIRVMAQRKPGGSWACTGYIVKVGAADKIVTNYYQGGSIWTLRKLHDRLALSAQEMDRRTRLLTSKTLRMANTLSAKRQGMQEMGIDFAFDTDNRLWVLEVNSNHPQFHPLKRLDPQAYHKMMRYAASYGRQDAK